MKTAIFPGTFSVFHEGHLDILQKALKIFDFIYIVVAINPEKKKDDLKDRYELVKKTIKDLKINNVEVIICDSKISDIAKIKNTCFIIRGMRDVNDFEYELKLNDLYKSDYEKLEIIYFFSHINNRKISSRKILKKQS